MKLYIDTEFNSYRGELISMALVDEDGKHFYEVLHFPACDPGACDPWVRKNVLPVLDKEPVGLNAFQRSLWGYLSAYDAIHVVADYPTDIQHFCWALETGPGERIPTAPMTLEIRRDLHTGKSAVPHNALADAHALRAMEMALRGVISDV
jgi:hypothetical protein